MENSQEGLKYWLAISQIKAIGAIRFQRLINYFGDIKNAWQANIVDLKSSGIEEKLAHQIIIERSGINPDEELDKMVKANVKAIRIIDEDYPLLLKEIYDYPPILYYRGSLNFLKQSTVAIIGARKFSSYGKQVAQEISRDLARQKVSIISGLALGIDGLAHSGCLEGGGLTAAILGSSVEDENVYPATNRQLAQKILESGGCLMSEYPIGTHPDKKTFPQRNRIISGLSLGTLIIEARESSGSLITAKCALEQNREVFAVPGSIYNPISFGTNNLIKQGARLVTQADDILEELNLQQAMDFTPEKSLSPENPEEEIILNILSREPTHVDKISQISKLKINALSSFLTMMEIKGMIKDLGGKNYIKNNK